MAFIEGILPFEFIACDTISISYDRTGLASVQFTVISTFPEPQQDYTTLTAGGILFSGHITNVDLRPIEGTAVYEHAFSMTATGSMV